MLYIEKPRRGRLRTRRQRRHFSRSIGHPNDQQIVPSNFLAPELERIIARLDLEQADAAHNNRNLDNNGGLATLAECAARRNGHNPHNYIRRIYDIRRYRSRSSTLDLADRLIIAAGEHLSEVPIPIFPAGIAAAREMVDVHYDIVTEEKAPSKLERERMARSMVKMAEGASLGFDVIDLEVCNGLEAMFEPNRVGQERELVAA